MKTLVLCMILAIFGAGSYLCADGAAKVISGNARTHAVLVEP
jgi:hypothetical protein